MRVLRVLGPNQPVSFLKINKPKLINSNNFLVKTLFSPINPSDFGFISDVYGRNKWKNYPKPLGFEGVGVIEEAPQNFKTLIGEKIIFCCNYEDPE
jgi:NADPH:quinone reductase-like Zn-dependent oxidoreductase